MLLKRSLKFLALLCLVFSFGVFSAQKEILFERSLINQQQKNPDGKSIGRTSNGLLVFLDVVIRERMDSYSSGPYAYSLAFYTDEFRFVNRVSFGGDINRIASFPNIQNDKLYFCNIDEGYSQNTIYIYDVISDEFEYSLTYSKDSENIAHFPNCETIKPDVSGDLYIFAYDGLSGGLGTQSLWRVTDGKIVYVTESSFPESSFIGVSQGKAFFQQRRTSGNQKKRDIHIYDFIQNDWKSFLNDGNRAFPYLYSNSEFEIVSFLHPNSDNKCTTHG